MKSCIKCKYEDEDNTLRLIVKTETMSEYEIRENGILKLYDEDVFESFYLECPVCGAKYEIDGNESGDLYIEVSHELVSTNRSKPPYSKPININKLKLKLMEQ